MSSHYRLVALQILAACLLMVQTGCKMGAKNSQVSFQVGGVYSVDDDIGNILVAKILKLDSNEVHLRIYNNRFSERPKDVQMNTLTVPTLNQESGLGQNHIEMDKEQFMGWLPEYIKTVEVSDSELEGYYEWKNIMDEM